MTTSSRKEVRGTNERWFRAPFAGIACTLVWAFLINAMAGVGAPEGQHMWTLSYVALSIAMPIMGLLSKLKPSVLSLKVVPVVMIAIGVVGTVGLYAADAFPALGALRLPAVVACSCALGWMYLQWALFFIRLDVRQSVLCLFTANIAGSLIKELAHVMPLAGTCMVAACMPVLSCVLCWWAMRLLPKHDEARHKRLESESPRGVWKIAAPVVVFSFVTAFLIGSFAGNQSSLSIGEFTAARAFEIAVSAMALIVVCVWRKPFNFAQLWRVILLVLAIDMVCAIALSQFGMLRCVESSVWDLLVLFAWLTVADFAKRTNESPSLVFGIGWPFYTLPFAAGTFASSFSPGSVSTAAIALLMLVLLITAMACLETRDQDTKQLFAEASEEAQAPTRPSDYDNIDDRCKQIAEQYSLTPRELDVMQLLCKGRTKAYIAETLFLTENTVRGHTKHLYTKLDVHSKQELLDLIGCA